LAVELSNLILKIGPYFLFYATRDTTNLPVVFEDTDRGSRSNICVRLLLFKGFSMVIRLLIVAKH
jgi:hypothetical protein